MIEKMNVNVPSGLSDGVKDTLRILLDSYVKFLTYGDCTHPRNQLYCEDCEDTTEDCNCFSCSVICGQCQETVEDINGHGIECSEVGGMQLATYKQMMARKVKSLRKLLVEEMKKQERTGVKK